MNGLKVKRVKTKKPRFKDKESRLHFHAKEDLATWLKSNPKLLGLNEIVKICIERTFVTHGHIIFVPDLTVYDKNGIRFYVEICKDNPVSESKLNNIRVFNILHNWTGIELIEISAKWIMDQCSIPAELIYLKRMEC